MPPRNRTTKLTPDSELSGQKGMNIVEEIVLDMGYLLHPRGPFDPGIDGRVELRDVRTGEPLARYLGVQSKGWAKFTAENDDTFECLCDDGDIAYWMRSADPVLLVCSHPATREAWFKVVTDWFVDGERRAARRVVFDKHADRFDASRAADLMRLGLRAEPVIPRRAPAPPERLLSNLLPILGYPRSIWSAPSAHREPWQVRQRYEQLESADELDEPRTIGFLLRDGRLYSFRDPRSCALKHVCDLSDVQCVDVENWADSSQAHLQRYWVELLRRTLLEQLDDRLQWHPLRHVFYFPALDPLGELSIVGAHGLPRLVVKVEHYFDKRLNEQRLRYIRHHGFAPSFVRIEGQWHLAIDPDYLFTWDGQKEALRADEYLAGIKRRERNLAVIGHLEMWEHVLTEQSSLFAEGVRSLHFGSLVAVDVPVGLDDKAWLGKDTGEGNPKQDELAA